MTNPRADFPDFLQPPSYVYRGVFSGAITVVGKSFPVASYAALRIQLSNSNGTSPLVAQYHFQDSASGVLVDVGLLSADATAAAPDWPTWTLPVVGDTFALLANDANVGATIIGTNQPLTKRMASDFYPFRTFQGTIAANAASGTIVELTGQEANTNTVIPQIDCSNYNGQVFYQWRSDAAAPTGDLFMKSRDAAGTEQLTKAFPGQNFSTTVQRVSAGHPFGYVKWRFVSNAVQGAAPANLILLVIPAESAR